MQEDSHDKNIVLVGMMGAGKSYIGKKLAKLLSHFDFIDIDEKIEKEQGMTISEIFEKYSEEHFRKMEEKAIQELSSKKRYIISTGGGAFENSKNVKALKQNGIIFYLKAPFDELFRRVQNQENRPLLNGENALEMLKTLLKKRERNYKKADFTIDTNNKQAYTILDDILREYEGYVTKRNLG